LSFCLCCLIHGLLGVEFTAAAATIGTVHNISHNLQEMSHPLVVVLEWKNQWSMMMIPTHLLQQETSYHPLRRWYGGAGVCALGGIGAFTFC
jgi:hypothetical protein